MSTRDTGRRGTEPPLPCEAETVQRPTPSKILFIEKGVGEGGSLVSLFYIIKRLNKDRFRPSVLCYSRTRFVDGLREGGVPCFVWTPPTDSNPDLTVKRAARRMLNVKSTSESRLLTALGNIKRRWSVLRPSAAKMAALLKREKIDIVHANTGLYYSSDVIQAASMAGIPVVSYERGYQNLDRYHRRLVRQVSAFACCSQFMLDHYRDQGIPSEKSYLAYDAVPLELYDPDTKPSLVSGTGSSVGILGRIIYWKGHKVFLQAAAMVLQRLPETRFFVVGDGPVRDELESHARTLGIDDHVVFTGQRDDVPGILASLDLLVHASTRPEPFGRVILEAMAMAKPVVATDLGAPREIVEDGVSGYLIPAGNPEVMAQRIVNILEDHRASREMGRHGRRRAGQSFSIEKTVGKLEEIYAAVLSSR
jgi:glycosyltransferase involved in cell wall biosynthesis